MTGAANKSVMASIAVCEHSVCVTPVIDQAAGPARSLRRADSPIPGPGTYNEPWVVRRSKRSAGIQDGFTDGACFETSVLNTCAEAECGV